MKTHKVLLFPSAREILVREATSLLEAARGAGLYIPSDCNGKGRCGRCRVRLIQGPTPPVSEAETTLLSAADRDQGYRLACRTTIWGDSSFWLPEENLLDPQASEKSFSLKTITLRPAVQEYEIAPPAFSKTPQTLPEAIRHLQNRQGLEALVEDPSLPQDLPASLGEEGKPLIARVWMDRELIDLRAGRVHPPLGLALDIGTTTVAVYLWDLHKGQLLAQGSFTNPQIRFGPDIMSRIHWSVNHPGEGAKTMQRELLEALNGFIRRMVGPLGFSSEDIVDAVAVGNPVMHHLFLGLAPDPLGLAPFTPVLRGPLDCKASSLGLDILPTAYVHLLPLIGGFVGADTVAVMLAEEPYCQEEPLLLLDLGTNGEIVLGNQEALFACSCATGPAFEGAHISCGQRAVPGAVERVRLDPLTWIPDYRVVGRKEWAREVPAGDLKPTGICGSGIIDLLAQLLQTGLVEPGGAFSVNREVPRLGRTPSGERVFLLISAAESSLGRDIVLSQKDIRHLQLAKAALYSGCRILMSRMGLKNLSHIRIAGSFGLHIDPHHALSLGLFPKCPPQAVAAVGNAAGHGACLALLDREKRKEAEKVAGRTVHVELVSDPQFPKTFLQALSFPEKVRADIPFSS